MEPETRVDIEKRVEQLLKESGATEPPLDLSVLSRHLEVDTGYYDLQDPGLVREIEHKVRIGIHSIKDIVGRVALKGLWLPDRDQILIDSSVPEIKKRWATAHELAHRLLPAHSDMFLGDTAETLDPITAVQLST